MQQDVGVNVHQTGKQRHAGKVDHLGIAGRQLGGRSYSGDGVSLDQHCLAIPHLAIRRIKDPGRLQQIG